MSAVEPVREGEGADIVGPRNADRERLDPFPVRPPASDHGTMPNLKWSFADSHIRIEEGGWPVRPPSANCRSPRPWLESICASRQAPSRASLAQGSGVVLYAEGQCPQHAVEEMGRTFADDVCEGDLWYFPTGIPHSIQGLGSEVDGCEFLLVFDDGNFSEDSTFLLTDWLAHTPRDVLAKNFRTSEAKLEKLQSKELYIFPAPLPGALSEDRMTGAGPVPNTFSYRLLRQEPNRMAGKVRIVDSSNFAASKTIAAALVELEPGALRELHWHLNADEWQYYLEGEGRMTVFGSESKARTFDYRAGDVGYVPFAMGHYIENTGSGPLRFLEMLRSDRYADLSLNQWLALTPHALVDAHLKIDPEIVSSLSTAKVPILPK